MRIRHQKGSLRRLQDGVWEAQWRDQGGKRRKRHIRALSKGEAAAVLAEVVRAVNLAASQPVPVWTLEEYVKVRFLPFYERKWKRSTAATNRDRIMNHVIKQFGGATIGSITRDALQGLLDEKAEQGLSFSVVNHLRWDLRQIFGMAVEEQVLERNPAGILFTPRSCRRESGRVMTGDEAKRLVDSFKFVRERLIVKLAVIAGLRPGEIFALRWGCFEPAGVRVRERVYKGEIDTPKSHHSVRLAAVPDGLVRDIEEWRQFGLPTGPDDWVFPSERRTTPVAKDNWSRRHFQPISKSIGLEWVDFQVMRRTANTMMFEEGVDPRVRAEQLGHTQDVNENVYTHVAVERRRDAKNTVEKAVFVN